MKLKIPVLNMDGTAELAGIKADPGGAVTVLLRGLTPAMIKGKEIPLQLEAAEASRLLAGLQGIERDRAAARAAG